MYHNNEHDQYNNSNLPSTAGVFNTAPQQCTYNNANFTLPGGSNLNEESEEETSDSSASSSDDDQQCTVCLQSRCVCDANNGFDPAALLQLQLPQIALLMQQQSPSSSSSSSYTSPVKCAENLSQSPPFVCQVCQEWFVVHEKLVLHLVVNHSMVYCKFCARLFRSQAEHTVCLAHRGTVPCQICHAHFRTNSSSTNHELSLHQIQMHDLHTCPLCGLAFRPKDSFITHLKKKHHCKNYQFIEENSHLEGIVTEDCNAWTFNCKLCKCDIKKPELFGHFNGYHKLTLPCLIELLHYGRIFISVQGYSSIPQESNSGIQYNEQIQDFSCNVCSKTYNSQVPKIAHDIFCSGMAFCKYCTLTFTSPLVRELHLVREHANVSCLSCGESFPYESTLTTHYSRCHGVVECFCCDMLVPVTSGGLENHVVTRHVCNVPANMTVLCNVGNILACNLCMTATKYTCPSNDICSMFTHLLQDHFVTQNKALTLISLEISEEKEKPEIPQFSQWTDPGSNMKEEEEENILVPQVNLNAVSENESSGEQSSEGHHEEETSDLEEDPSGEPEVDPEDMDCVSDSSEDEEMSPHEVHKLECEFCSEKTFASPRDMCAHLFSMHKLHWDRKSFGEESDGQYHCFCGFKCPDRPTLALHRQAHGIETAVRGTRCRFCPQYFTEAEVRNQHQLQAHADQQRRFYRCPHCQLVTSSTVVMSRHLLMSHPTEPPGCGVHLKCRVCLFLYPSLSLLRAHFRAVHPAAMVFRCKHCSAHLKTRKTLRHHVKVVHSESRRKDCATCGKVLWSKRAYAIHYRMKHSRTSKVGFRCRICQQRFDSKEQRKLHYTLDHEGESPYHCVDCGKGFASKSGMYGHRQLHTGSGVSKCEYCGKEFTRKDSYNEHLLIHNGPRHKCPHCPKEFVQRSNLVRHIRIHTGEKPYKCTFCEKRFSDKGACNSHIRVHTREETCSCPYCGQTFSKKQKLKYHIRKHTGEGLIECEICNKMFTNSFALKEHRVIHNRQTQVVCPQCGKGFNSEKYLQRHVAIVHEPSNAFSCPLCPKTFSQQARLKAHVMTHSGVKHMKCLLCDKAYSVRKSLRRHLLEKHQVSPEHPQYKLSFHAMSPEEAGLGLAVAAKPRRNSPRTSPSSQPSAEPATTSGRKRRRVEQIVQSLHSLSQPSCSNTPSPSLTPLVINLSKAGGRKKMTVRARSKAELKKRHRTESSSEDEEGLNLTIVVKSDAEKLDAAASDS